jgi:hypothetical protein
VQAPFRITFPLEGLRDRDLAKAELRVLIAALAAVNLQAFERNALPTLAAAPVALTEARSRLMPANQEEWRDASTALDTGYLDGPSAVAWRVAELQAKGAGAVPEIVDDGARVRFVVRLPDGQREDVAPVRGRPLAPRLRVSFLLDLFKSKAQEPMSHEALRVLLQAVTLIDVLYLSAHPETPPIYASGVRYREEPSGAEDWQDIPTCLRRKVADCDDVACWRAAELIAQGIPARPDFEIQRGENGSVLYHIVTRTPRGTEDPSYVMGMR